MPTVTSISFSSVTIRAQARPMRRAMRSKPEGPATNSAVAAASARTGSGCSTTTAEAPRAG
jgi:hypothetical protein